MAQSYNYVRYMRDGSVKEITAVVRNKNNRHKSKKKEKNVKEPART